MATLQLRRGSYRVLFVYNGKRQTFTLGPVKWEFAEAKAAKVDELLAMLRSGYLSIPAGQSVIDFMRSDGKPVLVAIETPPPPPSASLAQLREEYLRTHRNSLEANTLAGIETHFKHLIFTFGESFELNSLSLADLQRHADRRALMKNVKQVPISPVTIRKDLVSFRAAWNWGRENRLVSAAFPPLRRVRFAKPEDKPPFQTWAEIERQIQIGSLTGVRADALWESLYLLPDEVKALLEHVQKNATQPWLYPMICTAAYTGARRSELLRMEAGDVDLVHTGDVTIRERKRVHGRKTSRRVPVTPFLKSVLEMWYRVRPCGRFLFCRSGTLARSKTRSPTTGHEDERTRASTRKERLAKVYPRTEVGISPLTQDEIGDHFDRTLSRSKWEVLRGWHVLRHSFISALAAAGTDQRLIDEFVGHTTDEQRRRYRHLAPDIRRNAIDGVFTKPPLRKEEES